MLTLLILLTLSAAVLVPRPCSHMAPELLRYGRLSPGVDIYAFGVS